MHGLNCNLFHAFQIHFQNHFPDSLSDNSERGAITQTNFIHFWLRIFENLKNLKNSKEYLQVWSENLKFLKNLENPRKS